MADALFPHLRSMTGQGRSETSSAAGTLVTEIRSVNHRGLKIILRTNDSLSAHEGDISAALRGRVERGTVTVHATLKPPAGQDLPRINHEVIAAYVSQLTSATEHFESVTRIDLSGLMTLPGVLCSDLLNEEDDREQAAQRRVLIAEGVSVAVDRFNHMRHHEAVAMAKVLQSELDIIDERTTAIQALAPEVIQRYRERLMDKVQTLLAEHDLPNTPIDIIREVQIFADRSDISEELTRLAAHVQLFRSVLVGEHQNAPPKQDDESGTGCQDLPRIASEAVGRKLDFIIQEMFRETNTIGSKASNAKVAEEIVEIKCAIERMRELVQNME